MTTTSGDLSTAPAVIAAWEELQGRFEAVESELDDMATTASHLADGAADFATGTEHDAAQQLQEALDNVRAAKEGVDAAVTALHEEWDAHIAAAEGRQAAAHAPFQEA